MARYLFASHDGFGLGHVRRNTLVARAILAREADAEITLVTGLPMRPTWLGDDRLRVVQVPALLKDTTGAYRHASLSFEQAIAQRAQAFQQAVASSRPDVVVVDRHPYGLGGELQAGLGDAARHGAALVLGLRDVLDQPSTVIEELAGDGWTGVADRFDELIVYGEPVLCDHEAEYGLPAAPTYCGWVAERSTPRTREPGLVVVTGGGGGDGEAVFTLGAQLAEQSVVGRVVVVAGPYAGSAVVDGLVRESARQPKLQVVRGAACCADAFAGASAVVQMAGYNSTFESLAAGHRPVLVPRRTPRREQAIRASRLAALGLADVVDEGAPVDEVAWLLQRDRLLPEGALESAGIRLDGAERAGRTVSALAQAAVR